MVDALGADAGTFAVVAGAFFLGLSGGAWLANRWSPSRPRIAIAGAEVAIAILSLGVVAITKSAWLIALPPVVAEILKPVIPLLLVGLPAAAMGLVFPWVARAVSCGRRATVILYAVNTLGGLAGLAATVLVSLPTFGLSAAVVAAAGANLAAAALAWPLVPRAAPAPVHDRESAAPEAKLIAFASGFLILAQETLAQHQVAQVTVNSLFSSATVLTAVLLALAIAAILNATVPSLARPAPALLLAALGCAVQPFLFTVWTDGLIPLDWQLPPSDYALQAATLLAVAVIPPFVLVGLVFPAAVRLTHPDRVGSLLAWNGLGGWLGAELTNRFIAPLAGLWQTLILLGCGYAILLAKHRPRWAAALSVGLVVALLFAAQLPQVGLQSQETLRSLTVAREGVVASVERSAQDHRILFNNTYSLGGSLAGANQERQAHLPILLHGDAKRVATLGVATGSTLTGAALHSSVEAITAVELSPAAARIAREQFAEFNRDVFADPRVDLQIGDARWVIARHPDQFDVVVGDLFLPWRTGEGRLFTREHFLNVRRSLRPDGLFCQWLPLFQLTRPQFDAIVRTFAEVFPDVFLVRGDFYADQPIVGLVGGRALVQIDWTRVDAAAHRLAPEAPDPLVSHPEGVAMLVLGPPPPTSGPINTLGNAWLEWNAGLNIIGLAEPWFTDQPFSEFATSLSRAARAAIPADLRPSHAAGETLAASPSTDPRPLLPDALAGDVAADWATWPGQPKPFSR